MPDGKSFLDYAIPGASAVFGLGGSIMNYFSQRENRQTQIDLMREQNAFNERMMDKQMDWNSESAKVQRLAAAGLNPSLAFSDASNLGSAAVGAAVPNIEAPQANFSDVALNAAQAINLLADSSLSNEETKGRAIDNMYRDAYNLVTLDELDSRRQLNDVERAYKNLLAGITQRSAPSQVLAFDLANKKTILENAMIEAETHKFASEEALNKSLEALNWKENDYRIPMLRSAIKATLARAAADNAQVGYLGQLKWNVYENTLKTQAERAGIKMDNQMTKLLWPSVKESIQLELESTRKAIRQQGSDYWNPFRYVGMTFGGAAAGATSGYMRNSGLGSAKRVIVRGFAP